MWHQLVWSWWQNGFREYTALKNLDTIYWQEKLKGQILQIARRAAFDKMSTPDVSRMHMIFSGNPEILLYLCFSLARQYLLMFFTKTILFLLCFLLEREFLLMFFTITNI